MEINHIFPDWNSIYIHLLISINQNMILLIFLTSILCHDKLVWTNYFLIVTGTFTLKRKVEDRNGYYKDYDKVKRSRHFSKSWQTDQPFKPSVVIVETGNEPLYESDESDRENVFDELMEIEFEFEQS